MFPITALGFDNRFARLPPELFQRIDPTPLPGLEIVGLNPDGAALLDLDLDASSSEELAGYLAGGRRIPGAEPLAMLYAGHQFGVWVPQLGDGRAILLGQVRNQRGQSWDLQIKGGGPTRFARGGDGRAVLRSAIREYLAGEAMAGLGIATTRSLAIVRSSEQIRRETMEPAAILLRLSPSHVRFGSFEVLAARNRPDLLRVLADHVIAEHAPELAGRYGEWLQEVARATGRLMAAWQAAGFAHGVMNTDNMSVLGLTLDYGPYGFMERFDPGFIPNHSDHTGRYAFDQQPGIGLWNVARFAESLLPVLSREAAEASLEAYRVSFDAEMGRLLRSRLGLERIEDGDRELVAALFRLLRDTGTDYPRFMRALSAVSREGSEVPDPLSREVSDRPLLEGWLAAYRIRLEAEARDDAGRRAAMNQVNPEYVLRNWLAERAIRRAEDDGDYSEIERLRLLLRSPFQKRPGMETYTGNAPDWALDLVVSCSS